MKASKIRVLHLIDQYKIGGPGKTILNSARLIDRKQYVIHVATFVPELSKGTELSSKICEQGIPHLFLKDVRGITIKNFACLRSYIRKHKISIFHCHGYKSEFYAYLLKMLPNAPLLTVTYHGWITNNWVLKVIVRTTMMFSFIFDGIIVVAEDLMKRLPSATKTSTSCRVIHNAIVIDDYPIIGSRNALRKRYGIKQDEFVFGVIGRMSPEKGCFEAIAALCHLQRMSIKARLVMIGDGPLKLSLKQYAERLGVSGQMVFTGHVHPIQPIYAALDAVVSPSYTEGISNVILEALTLQKPVVATEVGGTPEIIIHGRNGILIPPRNATALAKSVAGLANDPEMRIRLASAGCVTIMEHFDFRQHMRKVEKFYEDILVVKHHGLCNRHANSPIHAVKKIYKQAKSGLSAIFALL